MDNTQGSSAGCHTDLGTGFGERELPCVGKSLVVPRGLRLEGWWC